MSNTDGRRQARLRSRADRQQIQQFKDRDRQQRKPVQKLKTLRLAQVFAIRKKLVNDVFYGCQEQVLEFEDLGALVERISEVIKDVDLGVWFETLRPIVGLELTAKKIGQVCWNLAANVKRLQAGEVVRSWSRQRHDEWVPVQIMKAWKAVSRKGAPGVWLQLCVLAGSPAGQVFSVFWSMKRARMFAPLLCFSTRFSKSTTAIKLQDVHELTLLRFYVWLDAENCFESLTFYHLKCPASFRKFNKTITESRRRRGFKCPKGYTHPCFRCVIGYDQCPVATHPTTYVRRFCEKCQTDSMFDPSSRETSCVVCTQIENNTKKEDS